MADEPEPIRVLGVLAGGDMAPAHLRAWADSANVVLAADGGADRLREIGLIPRTTLGDLDSISAEAVVTQTHLIRDEDQNSTDCDKLLRYAELQGFDAVTLAGVEGDLLDHVLGTVQSAAKSPLKVTLALRRGIGLLLKGECLARVKTLSGGRLSVIPLEISWGVSLTGTRWELKRAELNPLGLTSLSNVAEGEEVWISVEQGHLFVFVETDAAPRWSDG